MVIQDNVEKYVKMFKKYSDIKNIIKKTWKTAWKSVKVWSLYLP